MQIQRFKITSAKFERLERPIGPGWVMSITVEGPNIEKVGSPFRARVGDQPVIGLNIRSGGGRFQGFLERIPSPGDRLYVGYHIANLETDVVYDPDSRRQTIA